MSADQKSLGRVLVIGAGKMGRSILNGLVQHRDELGASLFSLDPAPARGDEEWHVFASANPACLAGSFDIVVLAVKPQTFAAGLALDPRIFSARSIVVSLMAGIPLEKIASAVPADVTVTRCMPGIGAVVQASATVAVSDKPLSTSDHDRLNRFFRAFGSIRWVESEEMLHAVTALAGSGPAYIALFTSAMASAGTALGLDVETAKALAAETLIGTAKLLASGLSPEQLCRDVASPGGTTEAALKILKGENALGDLVTRALTAASRRSRELAGG